MSSIVQSAQDSVTRLDVAIVGAGFAGLYMLHRARELGLKAAVIDANEDVGGCWWSTRYPGLRCDVESMQYSYSFSDEIQQEWEWQERYPLQQDIAKYLGHVADTLDLRRDIIFKTHVQSAHWIEESGSWDIRTDTGLRVEATYVVMATGALSVPIEPRIPGIEDFKGPILHSAFWPKEPVALAGKRVGLVGVGSSGLQIASAIAGEVGSLTVFQRTVPYVLELRNRPLDPKEVADIKAGYAGYRRRARRERAAVIMNGLKRKSIFDFTEAEVEAELERCWSEGGPIMNMTFTDVMTNRAANDKVADFIRRKVRSIVKDPEKARKLTPTTRYGAKRITISTNYYEIYNRPNVDVVALLETPIEKVAADGILVGGRKIPLDVLILATGYDAGTGPVKHIEVIGRGGADLNERWAVAATAYLGLCAADFPNLFVITGPGSPSVLSNCVVSIEEHVEWIGDCLLYLRAKGYRRIEAEPGAQLEWFKLCNDIAASTLFMDIDSWYNGGNVPGKARHFMFYAGGCPEYESIIAQVANDHYRGFVLS